MANIGQVLNTDIALMGDMAISSGGDLQTVSGLNNLQQALWHRLITLPGSLAYRPTYGIGISQYQNALSSFPVQSKLVDAIKKQFSSDPRIENVSAVAITSSDTDPEQVVIAVTLTPVGYTEQQMRFMPPLGSP